MPDPTLPVPSGPTRRHVVVGAGAAAVGAGLLAAGCSSTTADPTPAEATQPTTPAPGPLGPASEVPAGSAKIYPEQQVVVSQAEAGTFVGLSAICPHQGCEVGSVDGATIICPCHGSTFALDGSVLSGPARHGLDPRPVSVQDGQIILS